MCVDGRARGYRAPAGAMGLCERSYDCEIQVCTELPRNTFYTVRVLLQTGGSGGLCTLGTERREVQFVRAGRGVEVA